MLMPETGMGYQVVTVTLKDGTRFDQVAVIEGCITQIRGRKDIPFTEDDILKIVVTHDNWDFAREK
jgi:hypothetical protein